MRVLTLSIFSFILMIFAGCERPVNLTQTDNGIPPAVPTGLTLYSATDGEVILIWQQNTDKDLQDYNVYRSTDSLNYHKIGETQNSSFYDDSLSYDSTYYYEISAVDIWGRESKKTLPVSGKPINRYAPYPPRHLTINARNWQSDLSVYLSWDPSFDTDVNFYRIYRSTENNFTPDSTNLVGITKKLNFSDTTNLQLYKEYYYIIKSVDKGNLTSNPSTQISDQIYGIPKIIFPQNNAQTGYFQYFAIKAIKIPADYKIIVQNNQFFGTFWEKDFSSSSTNDTLYINFTANYINPNQYYYWRIATYSNGNTEPNSVSPLYKFLIKQ